MALSRLLVLWCCCSFPRAVGPLPLPVPSWMSLLCVWVSSASFGSRRSSCLFFVCVLVGPFGFICVCRAFFSPSCALFPVSVLPASVAGIIYATSVSSACLVRSSSVRLVVLSFLRAVFGPPLVSVACSRLPLVRLLAVTCFGRGVGFLPFLCLVLVFRLLGLFWSFARFAFAFAEEVPSVAALRFWVPVSVAVFFSSAFCFSFSHCLDFPLFPSCVLFLVFVLGLVFCLSLLLCRPLVLLKSVLFGFRFVCPFFVVCCLCLPLRVFAAFLFSSLFSRGVSFLLCGLLCLPTRTLFLFALFLPFPRLAVFPFRRGFRSSLLLAFGASGVVLCPLFPCVLVSSISDYCCIQRLTPCSSYGSLFGCTSPLTSPTSPTLRRFVLSFPLSVSASLFLYG